MKTNKASSLRPTSVTATKTSFSLPAFLRSKLRSRAVCGSCPVILGVAVPAMRPNCARARLYCGRSGTAQQWSVQVDKVDPGDVIIERSFRDAIYESLLAELAKTKQFQTAVTVAVIAMQRTFPVCSF